MMKEREEENVMMQEKQERKFCKIDILYMVDFIVNFALIVAILMYYRNLYLKTGPENFVEAMIYAGSGILLIACTVSIVTAIIELIYGILRIRGRGPYETGNLRHWAMMWVVLKVVGIVLAVIMSFAGVDLKSFLSL